MCLSTYLASKCQNNVLWAYCDCFWTIHSMPKHLNFSSVCRQNLIFEWVVFQTFICKLAFFVAVVSMGKLIPIPNVVKHWGLGSKREGSAEKKVSYVSGDRIKPEQIIFLKKVKLMSYLVRLRVLILEHRNLRHQGWLVKVNEHAGHLLGTE